MPVIKQDQPLPKRPPIILIYGDPGICKTSIIHTCEEPILIDFDRGVDRSHGRKDALVPENWQEVEVEDRGGLFKQYKTVGIDTAKAALDDFAMVHVCELDSSFARNKQRAYGEVGDLFKSFLNRRRTEQAAIIIVAHSKKDEDTKRIIPDVTGQSYSLLMRVADEVGYISMVNGKRTITWDPSDTTVGKNVAKLGKTIVPTLEDPAWPTFGAMLVKSVADGLAQMDEAQRQATERQNAYQDQIANAAEDNLVNDLLPVIESLKNEPAWMAIPLSKEIGDRVWGLVSLAATPDVLTSWIPDVNRLPEALSKGIKAGMMGVAKKNGWSYDEKEAKFKGKTGGSPAGGANTTPQGDGGQQGANGAQAGAKTGEDADEQYNNTYQTPEEVAVVLLRATTTTQVSKLYYANTEAVDKNASLNKAFQDKQAELRTAAKGGGVNA